MNKLELVPLSQGELMEVNGGSEAAFDAGVKVGESISKIVHLGALLLMLW